MATRQLVWEVRRGDQIQVNRKWWRITGKATRSGRVWLDLESTDGKGESSTMSYSTHSMIEVQRGS